MLTNLLKDLAQEIKQTICEYKHATKTIIAIYGSRLIHDANVWIEFPSSYQIN